MPYQATQSRTGSIGDNSFVSRYVDDGNLQLGGDVSIAVAKVGQLTTRTDNDTGVVTMVAGHGFATSDKIDLFWNVSGTYGSRRNMTATVATNAVTLDGGSGDNLPALNSAVTAMKPTSTTFVVTGNACTAIAVRAPQGGFIVFTESGPTDIAAATYTLTPSSPGRIWMLSTGDTNPLAGKTTTTVKFSHGDSVTAVNLTAVAVYD